jgi:hypothetical protein
MVFSFCSFSPFEVLFVTGCRIVQRRDLETVGGFGCLAFNIMRAV